MSSSNVFPRPNNNTRQIIRALRRSRRTVAFAVNHERSNNNNNLQPSNNMRELSTTTATSSKTTPDFCSSKNNYSACDSSSSLAAGTTQFTVNNKSIPTHTITTNNFKNFTVSQTVKNEQTRDYDGVRAIANRDSDSSLQQQQQQQHYVKDMNTGMFNSSNGNGNGSLSRTTTTTITDDNNNNKNNNNKINKKKPLSVNVKSTLSITPSASAFLCNGGPVPISPVDTATTTAVVAAAKSKLKSKSKSKSKSKPTTTTKTFHTTFPTVKRKRGRPSLKSKMLEALSLSSSSSCQTTCPVVPANAVKKPSLLTPVTATSPPQQQQQQQPKIQRVKYDMESVPLVQLNMKIWNAFRNNQSSHQNQDQATKNTSSLPRPIICNSNESSQNNNDSNLLLSESVLWTPSSRKEWEDTISEMKSVCTSAAYRRWFKDQSTQTQAQTTSSSTTAITNVNNNNHIFRPPMSQAFIKDRVKYDDPLMGYQIRHSTGGWLQGFILYTTMTVWTEDFQWNSTHSRCGLLEDSTTNLNNNNNNNNNLIDDGTLSTELQALKKSRQSDPDPLDGGIVLHGVAEISLLGGIGCGELLLRKAIEDIRTNKKQNYKYIVLEATEGSRSFYEKYGFKRVGAICKYRWIGATTTTTTTTTNGTNNNTSNTNNKNNTVVDPTIPLPPQMQGFRHWTYTNESAKSLKLHGGPSVMMCLKLYEEENNNNNNVSSTTAKISELLVPHIAKEKPTIMPLGNVSNPNPNGDDLTPTRRSSRGGKVQQEQDNNTSSMIGGMDNAVSSSGGRRASSRSKRGRNSALNSDYVVYGSTSVQQQQQQQQHNNRGSNNTGDSKTTTTSDNSINDSFARISTAISNINSEQSRYTRKVSMEDIPTSVLSVPPPPPIIAHPAPLSHPIIRTNKENNKKSSTSPSLPVSTSSPAPPAAITNNNSSSLKNSFNGVVMSSSNAMPAIIKNKNGCNDDTMSLLSTSASASESTRSTSHPMIISNDNSNNDNNNTSNDVIIMSSSSTKPASVSLSSSTPTESKPDQSLPAVGSKVNAPKRDGCGRFITTSNQRQRKTRSISSGVKKNDENSNIVHREGKKKVVVAPAGTKHGSTAAALAVSTSTITNVVKTITKNTGSVVKRSDRQRRRSSSSPVVKKTGIAPSRNTIVKTITTTVKTTTKNARPDVASATATAKTLALSSSKGKKKRKIDAVSSSSSVPSSSSSSSSSLPNVSLWQKQASSFLESDSAGGGGKRLRQAVISIDKTKLCKQKVKSYPRSRIHYYNKVVVRKRFNAVDAMPNGGPFRRHYNGGSMLDHRYEFCYYFVLHYDEPTQNVTLVPMIRQGLFMSGNKKRMGRYRYQCNILENNKNWILDASPNEYDIVPNAVMIMKTPVVAQEAWDIYGNEEEEAEQNE
jgi:hypothetical protein